jgi:hypothetical protein
MSLLGPNFPRLTAQNHRVTSPATQDYNCIAWAAGDTRRWWQPAVFWPFPVAPTAGDIQTLVQAYQSLGFAVCADGNLEAGYEKVALYGNFFFYLHAARQLPSGQWTSKLGADVDIEHDTPKDVAEGLYGVVMYFMRRSVPAAP